MPLTSHKGHKFHFTFAKYLTILQLDGIHSHIAGENDLPFPLLPFSILANTLFNSIISWLIAQLFLYQDLTFLIYELAIVEKFWLIHFQTPEFLSTVINEMK